MLPAIIDAKDARLEASILALAADIGLRQGITPQALAKRHGANLDDVQARVREWQVKLDVCRAALRLLRYVMSPILASHNPRLESEVIAAAARYRLNQGVSMTRMGSDYGICKAAISQRVRGWVAKLGLPLPPACKRNTKAYRLFNVANQSVNPFEE